MRLPAPKEDGKAFGLAFSPLPFFCTPFKAADYYT